MKRIVTALVVLVLLAALIVVATRDAPVEVETREVARGPLVVTLDEEGRTRVAERYVVLAPLDGLLHRVMLDAGDELALGETELVRVEPLAPALLDDRAVATARARVAAAEAGLERARELAGTAAELEVAAEEDLERRRAAGDGVSAQQRADARREVLFRRGEVAAAAAAARAAEAELEVARAALGAARPAEGEGGRADDSVALVVRSPIDGRVLRVARESEGPVRIGELLLELGDTGHLEIVADYLTSEAVRMAPGMEARIESSGLDVPLAARVRRVEPAARTKVSSLGVEEQRVDVVLDLVDPPPAAAALADGFRVEVRVVVWRAADVLLVPEAALVRTTDGWSAFVVSEGEAREVRVGVGHRDGRSAEVQSGLAAEDRVVVFPSDRLADGVRVSER